MSAAVPGSSRAEAAAGAPVRPFGPGAWMCRPPGARVEASAAGFPAVAPSSAGRKLLGEKLGPAAGVCESCNDRQHVLIAALTSEARLHSPDGEEPPRWDAVSLLNRSEQRGLGLLQSASASDDGRSPAFREKLVERQT